jgi:hypothetical protein
MKKQNIGEFNSSCYPGKEKARYQSQHREGSEICEGSRGRLHYHGYRAGFSQYPGALAARAVSKPWHMELRGNQDDEVQREKIGRANCEEAVSRGSHYPE